MTMWDSVWESVRQMNEPQEKEEQELRINDIVVCKVLNRTIVTNSELRYDNKISFRIIGLKAHVYSSPEYILYIPEYEISKIKPECRVNRTISKDFSVNSKFLDEHMVYVRKSHIYAKDELSYGENCCKCGEWIYKAGPNQENGTFICCSCRDNPYR